ncbi:hypothetical protein KKH59_03530 [Patescibacteria group bacterium]|nr:hypothetical protein [Patescibacteria group bacterium]
MLVAISIIIILTTISVPIYQGSRKQLSLQMSASKLAQDIRRAQEMAMAAREFQGSVPSVPSGGYGIYFNLSEPSHYILFADTSIPPNHQYNSGELVEDIPFENNIKISQLFPSSTTTIVFVPPDPTTLVNSYATTSIIVLKIDNSTSSVKVLPTGLIFIE